LSVAGTSGGGAVCAFARAMPEANHRKAQAKPCHAIRLVADSQFIAEAPFIRPLRYQVDG
jgi:hypothetical protein